MKANNRNELELEIASSIIEIMDNQVIDIVRFCIKDLPSLITRSKINYSKSMLREVLKNWNLSPEKNSLSYKRYSFTSDGHIYDNRDKGRYYTITKEFLTENFDDLMN